MGSLTIDILRENINALNESVKTLNSSRDQRVAIGVKSVYSIDELAYFEALASRYARTTDLLIHKVLRSLNAAEFIASGAIIDVANRAEKRGIVDSADQLRTLKDLRNEISHEYVGANYASKYLKKDAEHE